MIIDDKQIIITDEDGTENRFEILFTFAGDDSDIQYVLYYDPSNPEEIFASIVFFRRFTSTHPSKFEIHQLLFRNFRIQNVH